MAGLHVTGMEVFSMVIGWVPAESPIEKEAGKICQLPPAVEVSYWWVRWVFLTLPGQNLAPSPHVTYHPHPE
jgi:hypothetical protein